MSDTENTETTAEEMPPEVEEELEKIVSTTKRGFDLKARLKGRGLRKGRITLYLDEEIGVKLGQAEDMFDALGNKVERVREGVLGDLDVLQERKAAAVAGHEAEANSEGKHDASALDTKEIDKHIAQLEAKRDKLVKELTQSSIVIHMRAVPPVIHKDLRRRARKTLGIEEKNIPEDRQEEYNLAHTAHLMSAMFQSVTDSETGEVNTETTYEDAVDMMNELPPGQFERLDLLMGKVQYTDSISRSIEGQEDFS